MHWISAKARRLAGPVRRLAHSVVAIGVLAAMAQGAVARDGNSGSEQFFSQESGGESFPPPVAARGAVPQVFAPRASHVVRPLTVRMNARPKAVVAQGPSKPEKVPIFEDRTLRRGDAVMTANGIRIFTGSNAWPYRPEDFVALADAGRLDAHMHQILASLDRAPER